MSVSETQQEVDTKNFRLACVSGVDLNIALCFQIIGLSTLLAFFLLAIPLGTDGSMNKIAFTANQVIYCLFGFYLMRYNFEFSLPGMSDSFYNIIVGLSVALVILFYVLSFEGVIDTPITAVLRTVPPLFFSVLLITGYLIHARRLDAESSAKGGTSTDDIRVTMSPMRHKLSPPDSIDSSCMASSTCAHTADGRENADSSKGNGHFSGLSVSYLCLKNDLFGLSPRMIDMSGVMVVGSVTRQWARSFSMLLAVSATYMLCQYLAYVFQSATGILGEVGVYLIFSLSFMMIRPCVRFIGHLTDQHKTGGPSMEVLMEMTISFFFYTFYRNLFISIHSYSLFFIIKGIHVLSEVLNFSICFSQWYQGLLSHLFDRFADSPLVLQLLASVSGCRSADMIVQVQCFRYGMRLYLFISSILTFVLFFAFLRFGYNSSFYCLYDEISGAHYDLLMSMTFLSFIIELMVFWYTDVLCVSTYGHGILAVWQDFLLGKMGLSHKAVVVYMIWLMAHVSTDIYLSRLDASTIGGNDCPDIDY